MNPAAEVPSPSNPSPRINCRSRKSPACYHGKSVYTIYDPDGPGMSEDGTWDGQSVVCDACYLYIGQPAVPVSDPNSQTFGASIEQPEPEQEPEPEPEQEPEQPEQESNVRWAHSPDFAPFAEALKIRTNQVMAAVGVGKRSVYLLFTPFMGEGDLLDLDDPDQAKVFGVSLTPDEDDILHPVTEPREIGQLADLLSD